MTADTATHPSPTKPLRRKAYGWYDYLPATSNSDSQKTVEFRSDSTPQKPVTKPVSGNTTVTSPVLVNDGLMWVMLVAGAACLLAGLAISLLMGAVNVGILFPVGATLIFFASLIANHNRRGLLVGASRTA